MHLSQGHALLLLQHQTGDCTAGSSTVGETTLPYRLHPAVTFGALFFWERLLAEIQTVTKLFGFGKRAGLPHIKHTGGG